MAEELIEKIPGFDILEKVAEGGMGTVYKARQLSLDRIVAIKVLPARLAADAQFVRRFQEEARTAAKLKHPHLIEVYDAGQHEGKHYFVMEYVEGETVGTKLYRDGPFLEHTAVGICLHVAQALQYAWEKARLLHGDIKPENLILEKDSRKVRIADLGLGKSLLHRAEEGKGEEPTHAMGTPAYVCPELARGEKLTDFRGDMYALGATLYHMLTGKVPFEGLTPAEVLAGHLQGTLPDPRTYRSYLSENVVVVLERMMAKNPADRYPTWAALAHDLELLYNNRSPALPPLPPGKSTVARRLTPATERRKKQLTPLRLTLELAVVALIIVGIWYFKSRRQPLSRAPESSPPPPPAAETVTPQPPLPLPEEIAHTLPHGESPEELARREAEVRRLEEEHRQAEAQARAREARVKAEAEARWVAWSGQFETWLAGGDYQKARESAEELSRQEEMEPVRDRLARQARVAELLLLLRETARTNLVGQTYFVGATAGTVFRVESEKFWVRLAAGEVALNWDSLDAAKIPSLALSRNREEPDLNLAAALYCWYRGERDLAKTYFAMAAKAGADLTGYLPEALKEATTTVVAATESPEPADRAPRLDRANLLANARFDRWSGKTLLDWSTGGGAVRPTQDLVETADGTPSARFDCDFGQDSFSLEQPFHVIAGYKYRLTVRYRTQRFAGRLWVEAGPPGDPTPLLKRPLEGSSGWNEVVSEFTAPSTGTMGLRVKANGARGTVWFDDFDLRIVSR